MVNVLPIILRPCLPRFDYYIDMKLALLLPPQLLLLLSIAPESSCDVFTTTNAAAHPEAPEPLTPPLSPPLSPQEPKPKPDYGGPGHAEFVDVTDRMSALSTSYILLEQELATHPYRSLAVQQGTNCLTVGGGYSPPYSICEGCMIQEAMQCIDDMRYNVSGNVGAGCELQVRLWEGEGEGHLQK